MLPPLGEVVVVVDTDAPVPRLVSNVRVDLYDLEGNWRLSEDVPRSDPATWPFSFSLVLPDELQGRGALLRLRAHPDTKVRDYRGERFVPVPAPADYPDSCPPGDATSVENKRLLARDANGEPVVDDDGPVDQTPLLEPLPGLTIDRLVEVRVEPGRVASLRVDLASACFGTEANLFDRTTCVDEAHVYAPATTEPLSPDVGLGASAIGTWPGPRPCTATPRPPTEGLFDDEVCVDGGAFILGDLGVFGFGQFDAFPERVVALPALRVDRYEVTVGRFRAWWPDAPDTASLPLSRDEASEETARCTWSDAPDGREDHPLNCVDWATARAFCQADGGDLPTEAQWEWLAAAAGRPQQDRYPFGSTLADCDTAVHSRAGAPLEGATSCASLGEGPQPVGDARGDVTATEVVAMAGNLREMTLDEYRSYCSSGWEATDWDDPVCRDTGTDQRTVRGGDWSLPPDLLLSAIRDRGIGVTERSPRVGFRCVRPGMP